MRLMATLAVMGAMAGPHYDVPKGYTKCAEAKAWNGFFKWASTKHATCAHAAAFMKDYAAAADGLALPRRVDGYECSIRYWRDDEGEVYASRHTCSRGRVVVRFYGES
jgi:hypothetical protein